MTNWIVKRIELEKDGSDFLKWHTDIHYRIESFIRQKARKMGDEKNFTEWYYYARKTYIEDCEKEIR